MNTANNDFSEEEIAKILKVNDYMVYRHIEVWKEAHPNHREFSTSDVFLRRGLGLKSLLDDRNHYLEWDYINSYSLSITAPEKFSQSYSAKVSALVHGDIGLFESRILFFSPFIRGMDAGQLEFGIIPSHVAIPIMYQGEHGGIHEYIIGERPPSDA